MHAHQLARPGVGAQVLAQALRVVRDQVVGGVQDVPAGAVVLLQLDDTLDGVLTLEVGHVADARAAEGVDALVVVTDGEHALSAPWWLVGPRPAGRGCKHLQPGVLQPVGVLELVDQHVREAALVMLAQRIVVAQQLEGAQHQLGEVDHALALALGLVGLVDLDQLARVLVVHLDVARAQPVFLGAGDEPGHRLGHEALFVEVHRLDDALDRRELVGAVEDLEALRQTGELPVRAQEAVAQAVEGADPHAAHGHRQHRRQAREHLLGRLVREGHRHHAAGRDLTGRHQPGDARRQHPRLARTGTGQDQRRHTRQRDRRQLLGVQVFQQARFGRLHAAILGSSFVEIARVPFKRPPRIRLRRSAGGALRHAGRKALNSHSRARRRSLGAVASGGAAKPLRGWADQSLHSPAMVSSVISVGGPSSRDSGPGSGSRRFISQGSSCAAGSGRLSR